MSKHDLENMIFNLETRKDLKKVEFTQKAVIEVLGYLKQLADIEDNLENKKEELLQKEREIADLRQCEFVSTILDFNKLSADNCRLRDSISDLESKLGNYIRALDMAVEEIETAQDMLSDCHADDWAYSLNTSADYFLARTSEVKV